jgi:hypothetical protein
MQRIKKLLGLDDPLDSGILLTVQPIIYGRFGVFANAVLISIHINQAAADAHCQQLFNQQAAD